MDVAQAARAGAVSGGLGGRAVRGVAWAGGGQIARQLIQVPAAIVLARLLAPADFGLAGMALVLVAAAQILAEFGVGAALVQSAEPSRTTLASCFWANLALGAVAAALLAAMAPAAAAFYGDSRVGPVLAVASCTLVFAAGVAVPRALLVRAMDFAGDARAQLGGAVAGALVAMAAAAAGLGVWSLVLQALVANAATLALALWQAAWRPALAFSWTSLRPLLSFSSGVLGSNGLSYLTRNADNVLIGKFLGSGPLGYYALAYRIMLYPLTQVSGVISRVLFPALATLQQDRERFRRAYLASLSAIATVSFPMMLGLLAVAEDFIVVVFGAKWLPMQRVLELFCGLGLIQSIGTTVGTIYMSTGRTRTMFLASLAYAPLCLTAFVVGLRWGIEGVALAYALVSVAWLYGSLVLAFRTVGLRLGQFHRALAGPAAAAAAMYLAVAAVVRAAAGIEAAELRLGAAIAAGIASYALASLLFNRGHLGELAARLRAAARSGGAAA